MLPILRLLSKVTLAAGGQCGVMSGVVIWLVVVPVTPTHEIAQGVFAASSTASPTQKRLRQSVQRFKRDNNIV